MLERIKYQACPLCNSTEIKFLRNGDWSNYPLYNQALSPTIKWNICTGCSHVFTEGYMSPEMQKIVFAKTHGGQMVGGYLEQNRVISARMIDKVLPFVADGVWLDVGFGNGSLLFTAQEYGFTPLGLDLRADNVERMRAFGVEAHAIPLSELQTSRPCSVISMADVLEHMPFPKQALADVQRLLKPGGVFLLSLPNSENLVWEIMNQENVNPYWDEIEHFHNFSRSRLYSLLQEFGLKPLRYGISERYRVCMEIIAQK